VSWKTFTCEEHLCSGTFVQVKDLNTAFTINKLLLVKHTYIDSNSLVVVFSFFYQIEAIVEQVFQAAMEVSLGDNRLLGSPDTQLSRDNKTRVRKIKHICCVGVNADVCVSTHLHDAPVAELCRDLNFLCVFVHSEVEATVSLLQYDMVPALIIEQTAEGGETPWLRGRSATWDREQRRLCFC